MIYIIISFILVLVDQYTKYIARMTLSSGNVVGFIPKVIDFVYVENRGAAFGILQNSRYFLAVLTIIILLVLVLYIKKAKIKHPLFLISASLVFAGGTGNLIDRLALGYVTDFIHFMFVDFPCFNIADICVCVGAAMIVIYLLFINEYKGENDGR